MDNRVLALCELSNDLLYQKIPREKLSYYVDNSLFEGKTAADELKGQDIMSLYKENNIQIEYYENSSENFGVTFRGQATMSKKGCKVELYRESVKELARHSSFKDENPLDYDTALRIHLAHEFFHFLEYKQGALVSEKLDSITTLKVLSFSRTARINRCSEIAAHSFAKELLGLSVLPNYYDYLYLINTGKMATESFEKMLEKNHCLLYANY